MNFWLGTYDLGECYTDERPPHIDLDRSIWAALKADWTVWYLWQN